MFVDDASGSFRFIDSRDLATNWHRYEALAGWVADVDSGPSPDVVCSVVPLLHTLVGRSDFSAKLVALFGDADVWTRVLRRKVVSDVISDIVGAGTHPCAVLWAMWLAYEADRDDLQRAVDFVRSAPDDNYIVTHEGRSAWKDMFDGDGRPVISVTVILSRATWHRRTAVECILRELSQRRLLTASDKLMWLADAGPPFPASATPTSTGVVNHRRRTPHNGNRDAQISELRELVTGWYDQMRTTPSPSPERLEPQPSELRRKLPTSQVEPMGPELPVSPLAALPLEIWLRVADFIDSGDILGLKLALMGVIHPETFTRADFMRSVAMMYLRVPDMSEPWFWPARLSEINTIDIERAAERVLAWFNHNMPRVKADDPTLYGIWIDSIQNVLLNVAALCVLSMARIPRDTFPGPHSQWRQDDAAMLSRAINAGVLPKHIWRCFVDPVYLRLIVGLAKIPNKHPNVAVFQPPEGDAVRQVFAEFELAQRLYLYPRTFADIVGRYVADGDVKVTAVRVVASRHYEVAIFPGAFSGAGNRLDSVEVFVERPLNHDTIDVLGARTVFIDSEMLEVDDATAVTKLGVQLVHEKTPLLRVLPMQQSLGFLSGDSKMASTLESLELTNVTLLYPDAANLFLRGSSALVPLAPDFVGTGPEILDTITTLKLSFTPTMTAFLSLRRSSRLVRKTIVPDKFAEHVHELHLTDYPAGPIGANELREFTQLRKLIHRAVKYHASDNDDITNQFAASPAPVLGVSVLPMLTEFSSDNTLARNLRGAESLLSESRNLSKLHLIFPIRSADERERLVRTPIAIGPDLVSKAATLEELSLSTQDFDSNWFQRSDPPEISLPPPTVGAYTWLRQLRSLSVDGLSVSTDSFSTVCFALPMLEILVLRYPTVYEYELDQALVNVPIDPLDDSKLHTVWLELEDVSDEWMWFDAIRHCAPNLREFVLVTRQTDDVDQPPAQSPMSFMGEEVIHLEHFIYLSPRITWRDSQLVGLTRFKTSLRTLALGFTDALDLPPSPQFLDQWRFVQTKFPTIQSDVKNVPIENLFLFDARNIGPVTPPRISEVATRRGQGFPRLRVLHYMSPAYGAVVHDLTGVTTLDSVVEYSTPDQTHSPTLVGISPDSRSRSIRINPGDTVDIEERLQLFLDDIGLVNRFKTASML